MKYFNFIFILLSVSACNNQNVEKEDNSYSEEKVIEPVELWNQDITVSNNNRIQINPKSNDLNDIFITAENGNMASFVSTDFNCGEGPIFNLIGSIPQKDLVFIDRTYTCEGGETCLVVSLKDGSYRELNKGGIWKMEQFSISPNGNWLILSACDCSMGYECGMEILNLDSNNLLPNTDYFSSDFCICKNLSWKSDDSFYAETGIYDNSYNEECLTRPVRFQNTPSGWTSR
jgi:hypothetical protein